MKKSVKIAKKKSFFLAFFAHFIKEVVPPPLLLTALRSADVLFAETAVCRVTAPCGPGYTEEKPKTVLWAALSGEISFYKSVRLEKEHLEEQDPLAKAKRFCAVLSEKKAGLFTVTPSFICPL